MKAAYRHNVRHVSVLVFRQRCKSIGERTHTSNHTCYKQCILVFLSVATQFHTRKSHLNLLFLDFPLSNCVCVSVPTVQLHKHQDSRLLFAFSHSLLSFGIAQQSIELRRFE